MKDNCIFCKIAAGVISAKTLYEDEKFKVILDHGPANKGHALIVPKLHYEDLWDMPEDYLADSIKLARKVTAMMKEKLNYDGINLVQNNGYAAGQTVFHFHLHLIPRYDGDERMVSWQPGTPSEEELEEIRKLIVG